MKLKFSGFFTTFSFCVMIAEVLDTYLAFKKFKFSVWMTLTCNVL